MSKVTSEMVKELRERTNVGIIKCKEALQQTDGNMEKALDLLRKAGIVSAVKKESRKTNEGVIGYAETSKAIALIEVNTETDFVPQNEKFKTFIQNLCAEAVATSPPSCEAFLGQTLGNDPTMTVDHYRAQIVQMVGENIQIARLVILTKSPGSSFGIYSHMEGKLVSVVELIGSEDHHSLARDIAMHIAAESPAYLGPEDVPQAVKEREEEIARHQVSGKPEAILEKIVAGKMEAFYKETCLLHQLYIRDNTLTIGELLKQASLKCGKTLGVRNFLRWKVGG
jgi:elongation factor Ts